MSQPSSFPQDLEDLFKGNYADRNVNLNFLKYIRNYNACLSFASFEANVVQPMNHGPPYFRICGQVFHRIGNLRPIKIFRQHIVNYPSMIHLQQ